MGTRVEIVPYDPGWPKDYLAAEARLRELLPGTTSIEHIGSTAVPGLAAKPCIDIDVVLENEAHMQHCRLLLTDSGFEPRGSKYGDGIWAFLMRSTRPALRVYLCPPGNVTHDKRVLFRDILRTDKHLTDTYATLKMKLAEQYQYDGDGYTRAKTGFIEDALKHSRLA